MDYVQAPDSLRPRLRWCEKSKQPFPSINPFFARRTREKKMEKREAKKRERHKREDE
jgi:hypothetical protein